MMEAGDFSHLNGMDVSLRVKAVTRNTPFGHSMLRPMPAAGQLPGLAAVSGSLVM